MVTSGKQDRSREPPSPVAAGTAFVRRPLGAPGSNQYPGGRRWQVQPLLLRTRPLWEKLLGAEPRVAEGTLRWLQPSQGFLGNNHFS